MTTQPESVWTEACVVIVGDVMLDRFVYGDVRRISPESPVPVLSVRSRVTMPGGAANVARNVAALGGAARLIGLVGRDAAASELAVALDADGIEHSLLTADRPTTVKTRFIAAGQQVLRADDEATSPALDSEEALIERVALALDGATSLILSDYAKGTLTENVVAAAVDLARGLGLPVVVDPKANDLARYRNASVITPNQSETLAATGLPVSDDQEAVDAARAMRGLARSDAVLLTRGSLGMTLVEGESATHLRSVAREVFDVSGAGDTVVSVLGTALGLGVELRSAAELANTAAGIVVAKVGTATVTAGELETAMRGRRRRSTEALSWDEAALLVAAWRSDGLTIGFTNGCFDLLHPGHLHVLQRARDECDRLLVGLNSDRSVRQIKGPKRPVQSEADRAAVLDSLRSVDAVVIFDEETPLELISHLRPDVIVKGADYRAEDVVGADVVSANGGRVVLVDVLADYSTTRTLAQASMQPPGDGP